jgi:hypothetical protein
MVDELAETPRGISTLFVHLAHQLIASFYPKPPELANCE